MALSLQASVATINKSTRMATGSICIISSSTSILALISCGSSAYWRVTASPAIGASPTSGSRISEILTSHDRRPKGETSREGLRPRGLFRNSCSPLRHRRGRGNAYRPKTAPGSSSKWAKPQGQRQSPKASQRQYRSVIIRLRARSASGLARYQARVAYGAVRRLWPAIEAGMAEATRYLRVPRESIARQ